LSDGPDVEKVMANPYGGGVLDESIPSVSEGEFYAAYRPAGSPEGTPHPLPDPDPVSTYRATGDHLEDATRMMIETVSRGDQPIHYVNFLWTLLKAHGVFVEETRAIEELAERIQLLEHRQGIQKPPDLRKRVRTVQDMERLGGQT